MNKLHALIGALVAALATSLHAQGTAPMSDAEVRKVDKETAKITLKHGEIRNLDMPAMTMVFQVKDPGVLEQVKAGDKVRFAVEKTGGAYVVTHIETTR